MPIRITLIVLLVAFLAGCEKEAEEVVEPAAPPPPTPLEIADEFFATTGLNAPPPAPGTPLPPGYAQRFVGVVKNFRQANASGAEGKGAITIVSRKIDERITGFERVFLWEWVLAYSDGHVALHPDSTKWAISRERAIVALKKPKVTIKGLPEVLGEKVALLDFFLRAEGKRYSERLRIGDEMHGLKFVKVIGRDRGVMMEYLETGETFEVMMGGGK